MEIIMSINKIIKYKTFKNNEAFVEWQEEQVVNPEFSIVNVCPLFSSLSMNFENKVDDGVDFGSASVQNSDEVAVFVLYLS
jgi:hypothetical protein